MIPSCSRNISIGRQEKQRKAVAHRFPGKEMTLVILRSEEEREGKRKSYEGVWKLKAAKWKNISVWREGSVDKDACCLAGDPGSCPGIHTAALKRL